MNLETNTNLESNIIEKAFVINLKRRKDRIDKFLLKEHFLTGIELEIFEAIDGQLLSYDNSFHLNYLNENILNNKLIHKIKGLKVGEIGCFLSHYFIWKKIIELNKTCLIFEDDAKICNDFSLKLNNILKKGTPDNFDILWIGIRQNYMQRKIYNQTIKSNENKLIHNHYYHYENSRHNPFYPYCYIISPNTCKYLCNLFENENRFFPAVDHFICFNLKNNYICINNENEPYLCHAEQGDTDIQTFNNNVKNNKYLQ